MDEEDSQRNEPDATDLQSAFMRAAEQNQLVEKVLRMNMGEIAEAVNAVEASPKVCTMLLQLARGLKDLQQKGIKDPLTGLPNRAALQERLAEVIQELIRDEGKAAVLIFLDLDKFKPINDTYGHAVGDEVLKQVSSRVKGALRKIDMLARVGGDEFIILMNGAVNDEKLMNVLNRILDVFDGTSVRFKFSGNDQNPLAKDRMVTLKVEGTAGYIWVDPEQSLEANIKAADDNMYRIKREKGDTRKGKPKILKVEPAEQGSENEAVLEL